MTQIVKELEQKGRPSLMPIVFTSMLFEDDSLLGDNFKQGYIISQTPQVYLDCQVKNSAGSLIITWDYRKNKFEPQMIGQMFAEYCDSLEYFIYHEEDLCEYYQSYSKDLTLKLYYNFNRQTPAISWSGKTLITHFQETVQLYPDKEFVVINGQGYTFKEINSKALALAEKIKAIKEKGLKKKTRIVFLGNKSLNSIVCIVAALMTGDSFCAINEYFGEEKTKEVLDSIADYIYIEEFEVKEISAYFYD